MRRAAALAWLIVAGPAFAGGKPDLTVSLTGGPPLPSTVYVGPSGATLPIWFTASQSGGSGSTTSRVGIYLSTDTTITTADRLVGSMQVTLSPGQTIPFPAQATLATSFPAGRYYWGAIIDDLNQVSESSETNNSALGNAVQIVIDTTPPQITVTGVTNGMVTTTVPVNACYTVADANPSTDQGVLDGTSFRGCLATSTEGAHSLTVTATDLAGNSARTDLGFTINLGPPQISITGATNGELTNAVPVNVCYTATDATLVSDQGTLDGIPFRGCAVAVAQGQHVVTVTASDSVGNNATAGLSFTIDVVPPTLAVQAPISGAFVNSATAAVTAQATDVYGVASVRANGFELALGQDGLYHANIPLAQEGANSIVVVATDLAGNATTSATVSVIRDTTAASLAVATPQENEEVGTRVDVTGTASDANGVAVTVNGTAVTLSANGAFSRTLQLAAGDQTITVQATDAAANVRTIVRHVHVAPPPPPPPGGENAEYVYDAAGNLLQIRPRTP